MTLGKVVITKINMVRDRPLPLKLSLTFQLLKSPDPKLGWISWDLNQFRVFLKNLMNQLLLQTVHLWELKILQNFYPKSITNSMECLIEQWKNYSNSGKIMFQRSIGRKEKGNLKRPKFSILPNFKGTYQWTKQWRAKKTSNLKWGRKLISSNNLKIFTKWTSLILWTKTWTKSRLNSNKCKWAMITSKKQT